MAGTGVKKFKSIAKWNITDFNGEDLQWEVIRHGPLNYRVDYEVNTKRPSGVPWVMHFELGAGRFFTKLFAVRYARKEYMRVANEVALQAWKKDQETNETV